MSGLVDRLALVITADGAGAIKEFQKVGAAAEKDLGKAEDRTKKVGSQMQATGVAMIGAGALIVGAMVETAKASEEANVQHLKLDNTLKNSPQLANANKQAFLDQATAMQKLVVVDDEAIISTQAMLGQFGLTQSQIIEMTPLVVDLSRKMGIDLDSAVKMVGKSVDGSSGALKKAGITVDETAFKTDHYGATMTALSQKVGGFAESEGQTFAGQLEITKNRLHDVVEGVGVGAVDAFNKMLGPVQSLSDRFTELDAGTQSTIGTIGAFAGTGLIAVGAMSTLIGTTIKMKDNFVAAGQALKGMDFASAAGKAGILAAAFVLAGKDIENVLKTVKDTQEGIFKDVDFTEGIDATDAKLKIAGKSVDDLASKWNSYNRVEQMVHHAEGAAFDASLDQINQYAKKIESAREILGHLSQTTGLSVEKLNQLATSAHIDVASTGYDQLLPIMQGLANGTIDSAHAQADLKRAAGDTKGAEEDLGKAAEKASKAAKDGWDKALKSLKGYYDQAFGAVDGQRAIIEGQRNLIETVVENNKTAWGAFDMSTEAGVKNQEAFESAAKAVVEYGQRQAEAGVSQSENTAMVQAQVAKLREQAIAHGISAQKVDEYIAALKLTPPQIETQFNAPGLDQARADAERLANALGSAATQIDILRAKTSGDGSVLGGAAAFGGLFAARASGGPVAAGRPYVVGDGGTPELFVPKVDGAILNPAQVGQVAAAAGGSSTPTVIHTHVSIDGREIATAVTRYEGSIR